MDTPQRSIHSIAAELTELTGHLNAANYRYLMLIAEFDNRKGWSDGGTQSCAHWLNWQCGIDIGAAREKVRVAHALEKLPKISAAMERGQLSYAKVRALTRVACDATEDYFLMIAKHGTAHHVETLVRHFRRATEAEEMSREVQQQATRSFSYYYDDDGSLVFKGRMPAETGALLLKALQAGMDESSTLEVPHAGISVAMETSVVKAPSVPHSARRADALGLIAESFLKHGAETLDGGDRHQIVVHVSAETLRNREAGCCEHEHGPSMSADTARRLACDASVVALIENDKGEPLNVGRKTRTISPALRRALNARDRGCRFPGCCNQKWVDGHHIHHWANGGETKLTNLVSLCRFHHRLVHEGGVRIEVLDDGAFRFVRPDGRTYYSVLPTANGHFDWTSVQKPHTDSGVVIDSRTAKTLWRGETMDYGLAVESLMVKRGRAAQSTGDVVRVGLPSVNAGM